MIKSKQDIYDDICFLLTLYENKIRDNLDFEKEMYKLLVLIQNRWEDTITVQER